MDIVRIIPNCILTIFFLMTCFANAQVFKTQEEALQEAFATADTVLRQTVFLDDTEVEWLQKKSRSQFSSQVISYYVGIKNGTPTDYAFFEDQIVRTKKAIAMVLVTPGGTVKNVEVLAFYEPQDYLPIKRWFELFWGKELSANLWPGKEIHAVTGATLSVRSFTMSTRRALALFEFIRDHSS